MFSDFMGNMSIGALKFRPFQTECIHKITRKKSTHKIYIVRCLHVDHSFFVCVCFSSLESQIHYADHHHHRFFLSRSKRNKNHISNWLTTFFNRSIYSQFQLEMLMIRSSFHTTTKQNSILTKSINEYHIHIYFFIFLLWVHRFFVWLHPGATRFHCSKRSWSSSINCV